MVQKTFVHSNSLKNQYVISQRRDNKKRELNVHTNVIISNRKKLQLKILDDSRCIDTGINKQLVKEEQIKMEPLSRSFKVFNANGTKNIQVTQFVLLELEINGYMEKIDAIVTNINNTYSQNKNQLVKHNPEINWNKRTIQFTRCLKKCKIQYQNILFRSKTRRITLTEEMDKENQRIGKEPN